MAQPDKILPIVLYLEQLQQLGFVPDVTAGPFFCRIAVRKRGKEAAARDVHAAPQAGER